MALILIFVEWYCRKDGGMQSNQSLHSLELFSNLRKGDRHHSIVMVGHICRYKLVSD